ILPVPFKGSPPGRPLLSCRHRLGVTRHYTSKLRQYRDSWTQSGFPADSSETMKPIRKAVFPVAGLGTRFLPATKAMPKEMLPVVDKPLIQYAVEEAQAAGIEQFIFVTGRGKSALEDHFDHSYELEATLRERGKAAEIVAINSWMPKPGQLSYTRQQRPLGLGHAVWCARDLVGDEPFAVLLADDLILGRTPCLKQMVEAREKVGG